MDLQFADPSAALEYLENLPDSYAYEKLPSPSDYGIKHVIDLYTSLGLPERLQFIEKVKDRAQKNLRMFARRMAMLGVREKNPDHLRDGVIALILKEVPVENYYSTLMLLALLLHSVNKLELDVKAFFENAFQYANPISEDVVRHFLAREPVDQSIEAMGSAEVQGPNGLIYWNGPLESIPEGWR